MRRSPGAAVTAVLSIALGIGAATSIFSVVYGVVLDPFPYKDVDSLMSVKVWEPGQRGYRTGYTVDQFLEIAERNRIFSGVTVSTISDVAWTGHDEPQRLRGNHTTFDGLEIMGVPALVGRIFTRSDAAPGVPEVCVLSYRFWQRQFGGDPSVLGRTLLLNGKARAVVGVMPPRFMWRGPDVYLPLHFRRGQREEGVLFVHVVGRLKPGVTEAQAAADLHPIIDDLRRREPSQFPEKFQVGILSFAETFPSGIRETLWLLLAAVGLLLLIACANVSSLLLSESVSRQQEMAVRAAMGASRTRLIRQLLTESAVLALAGGALGVLFADLGMKAILALVPPFTIPDESEVRINLSVLAFSLATTMLTAFIFGLAPAWQGSRANLAGALKGAGRAAGPGRRQSLVRSTLVVTEVALSVVLLVSAGLMVRTMIAVETINLGVKTEKLLTLRVPLAETRYPDPRRRADFMESLLERLAAAPGVSAAAVNTNYHPFGNFGASVEIPGWTQQDSRRVVIHPVSQDYLTVYGIPLRRGRFFEPADIKGRRMVAVVSQRFVRRYFDGREALGATVRIPMLMKPPVRLSGDQFEIIGVAGDTLAGNLREEMPEIYLPHTLTGFADRLIVRAMSDSPMSVLPAVRSQVLAIDKDQPIFDVKTLEARLTENLFSSRRFNAVLFGVFAVLGLILASVGIYGVLANSVSRRTKEIGVRVALGASRGDVRRLILGEGARLLAVGVAIGLSAAWFTSQLLERLIWGVGRFDPVSVAAIALLLVAVGLLASWLPARRAARVEPMSALRHE